MSDLTPEPLGAGRVETRELDQEVRTSFLDYAMSVIVNGSSGIAVGMATNIPPHNLGEVVDAINAMIDDSNIDVERLSKHVKGPDFPTGGAIVGRGGIRDAYRSGRGRVTVRGRAHIEQLRGGKSAIIITELPYGARKAGEGGVIEKIA